MAHYTENNAQGFTPTRPRAERIRFVSEYTGEHVLDTYLEHAERGGRSLSDLMSDIFNSSGQFADLFEFLPLAAQDRIGIYSDQTLAGPTSNPCSAPAVSLRRTRPTTSSRW